ncbi:MAG: redox-regulated ATPase YchF [Candidatus Poseidoniia archaeon]|jgi:hypothetical protein|nr:redox-regulated ATPase YchF [Candidatus Poseidoniia archaeon]
MKVGLVGKPNAGKSTFFSAATAADAQIGDYPFTTIDTSVGVAHVRRECPCSSLEVTCEPHNSPCLEGTRYLPVELVDVAGLVPGAHEGKGMGNQFLDDLRQADVLIQVVDASGNTDLEGNHVDRADPMAEVEFLAGEVHYWLAGIILRNWKRSARAVESGRTLEEFLGERLAGLGFSREQVVAALRKCDLPENVQTWSGADGLALARTLQVLGKPILVAANKADIAPTQNIEALVKTGGIPVAADYELALRNASKADIIAYRPGDTEFTLTENATLNDAQRDGLEIIADFISGDGTGVLRCLEQAVLGRLDLIAAFPVEDETHYADSHGKVLPDGYLLPRGATALELAYKVHSDIGDGFIRAIDCRTKRIIGKDHVLRDGDVVKIVAG